MDELLTKIKTVLFGVDGGYGICKRVEKAESKIDKLEDRMTIAEKVLEFGNDVKKMRRWLIVTCISMGGVVIALLGVVASA